MIEDEIINKLPKDKLEIFKAALEGYRQGVIDTGKMVEEIFSKTRELYDVKIKQLEDKLNKA